MTRPLLVDLAVLEDHLLEAGDLYNADALSRARVIIAASQHYDYKLDYVIEKVVAEIGRGAVLHGTMQTQHHGYAVMKEELDEVWDEIKDNNHDAALEEAIEVAATACRFVLDLSRVGVVGG